jgi:hypothetical protein
MTRRLDRLVGLVCRSVGRSVGGLGWLVGCSQNSLTTRFAAFLAEYPQVKEGSTHSRSEALFEPADRLGDEAIVGSHVWHMPEHHFTPSIG